MGTLAVSANVAESMPLSMGEMVEDEPSFTPTEPAKKIPTTLKQVGQRRDYQMIDPRLIDIEEDFNPRNFDLPENQESPEDLALEASISEVGLIQPLIVRFNRETGRATLVDGERRLRSIRRLIAKGHPVLSEADVPCFPAPAGSNDKASRILTAITANTGKPLSKWELGVAFQKLYNLGLSNEKITARTGYSNAFITQAMELADAPEEIRQMISSQAVTSSLALAEIRANGAAAVDTLREKAQSAKSSGQKTAKRVKAPSVSRLQTKPAPTPSSVMPVNVSKAILSLVEDVPADDLNLEENEWVSVNRVKLLKLLSFAITEDDLKAAGVETANF